VFRPRVAALAAIIVAFAALTFPALSAADDSDSRRENTAILVLIPQDLESPPSYSEDILDGFADIPELSIGLTSSTQGSYRREQALLDISQGARVSLGIKLCGASGRVMLLDSVSGGR